MMHTQDDDQNEPNYINGTILIVTDNADINMVLGGVFGLNGFSCLKCTTAEEALRIFDEKFNEIDSLLIDGNIASDRSTTIIVKVKNKKPEVKIIVVGSKNSIKTRVFDYGADEFVLKPISAEALSNKVITQLAKR